MMSGKSAERVQPTDSASASSPLRVPADSPVPMPVLGVTVYDRVLSLLVTCIVTIGLFTGVFGAVWLSNHGSVTKPRPAVVRVIDLINDVGGGGTEEGELDSDPFAPGPEATDVNTSDPDDFGSSAPAVRLTVMDVLDGVDAALANSEVLTMGAEIGSSLLSGGNLNGIGAKRPLGGAPGIHGGVKRQARWEITFGADQSEDAYARQLDYFQVELGAISDGKLYLVSGLARSKPVMRELSGVPDEKRLYFSWRTGMRRQLDLSLLTRAGVPVDGSSIVLQFYAAETEQRLASLERDYLQNAKNHSDLRVVRKTQFSVIRTPSGFDFQIFKQEYFGDPPGAV